MNVRPALRPTLKRTATPLQDVSAEEGVGQGQAALISRGPQSGRHEFEGSPITKVGHSERYGVALQFRRR